MDLSINILGWFSRFKNAIPAQLIKFNRYSLVFNSSKKLKAGQLIHLNISAGLHSLREVKARVEHCERCGPQYQSQVRFILERPDKQPYREAISILKSIEKTLPESVRAPLHT
ncbi:MAG: hypothetical protein V7785_01745 [Bermanella sp.]